MIQSIKSNETSFAVAQLHQIMQLFKLPVDAKEHLVKKAGKDTQKSIQAWQKKQQIPVNSNQLVDSATATAITKELQRLGYLDSKLRNTVSGKVLEAVGNTIAKIKMLAFDLDLKGIGVYKDLKFAKELLAQAAGFEYLGEATSDEKGLYEVVYYNWMFSKSERKRADVVIFAIAGDKIIGRSALVQNTGRFTQDIPVILDVVTKTRGEYKPLYNGLLSTYLKENGMILKDISASQDYLSFISGELDIPLEKLQHIVAAHALNDSTKGKLIPELLYGLARQKITLDLERLFGTSVEVLQQAIKQAIKEKDIDTYSQKKIDAFIDVLHSFGAKKILSSKDPGSETVNELLKLSLGKEEDRVLYAKLKTQYIGTNEDDFWQNYLPKHSKFKKETIASLRQDQEVFTLSGFHLPMLKAIKKTNPKELKALVTWNTAEWEKLVKNTDVPNHIKGKTKAQKIKNYAQQLENTVNTKFTTAALQHKINTGQLKFEAGNARNGVYKKIGKFLSSAKDFDIKTSSLKAYTDKLKDLPEKEKKGQYELFSEIKTLQRLARVNPDTSQIDTLLNKNLLSAISMAEIPKKTFLKQYSEDFGGIQIAEILYSNAVKISAQVSLTETAIRENMSSLIPAYVLPPEIRERLELPLKEAWPGYSKVFNLSLCECRHCNSVYSPAAYFVDLMRYLERGSEKEGENPLDTFQERRPDLFHLPLSCENSNTLIPYIDLANEVMENFIYYSDFSLYPSADTGSATPEELRAQPQHIQTGTEDKPGPYEVLSTVMHPFTLPFNLPLETLRLYCEQIGTSWYKVLKTTHQADAAESKSLLNATYLNLSEKEFEMLTDRNFEGNSVGINVRELYGNVTRITDLSEVPIFLQKTGLTYVELIALLQTKYINPHLEKLEYVNTVFANSTMPPSELFNSLEAMAASTATDPVSSVVRLPDSVFPYRERLMEEINKRLGISKVTKRKIKRWLQENFEDLKKVLTLYQAESDCDLETTQIRAIGNINDLRKNVLTETTAFKLHGVIRLWRKLGWQIEDLDIMISTFSVSKFNTEFLNTISQAKQFIDQTELAPEEASVLWGSMDASRKNGLYSRLFLSRNRDVNPVFIQTEEKALFEDAEKLNEYTEDLLAAFEIDETALETIYTNEGIASNTAKLTIESISVIYRYLIFAKASDISVRDLVDYMNIFDLSPFESPANSMASLEKIRNVKSSSFSTDELRYIILSDLADSTVKIPSELDISEQATRLLEAYAGIEAKELLDLVEKLKIEHADIDEDELQVLVELAIAAAKMEMKQILTYNSVGDFLNLSSEVVKTLATTEIDTWIVDANPDDFKSSILDLHLASVPVEKFKLKKEEIAHLTAQNVKFDNLDFKNLSVITWWRLYDYTNLRESLPKSDEQLISLFARDKTDSAENKKDVLELIAKLTQWNSSDIEYLINSNSIDLEDFNNEKTLLSMQKGFQLAFTIGITVESLYALKLENESTFDTIWTKSQKLKKLLKAKYGEDSWPTVATKLNDTLREKQRDALVSYLLTMDLKNNDQSITDANGLYEFFLLDVQMSACMETSRIVQASAAVQQFVNRTHLNLENKVEIDALDRNRWAWMKQYRVWEAQMRIWYENSSFLNPEWRMDKSPFFEELESHLTQNDITQRTAEEALRNYLKSMDEVANLNVAGMYEETVDKGNAKIVHVFGHTNNKPYTYYYRTYNQYGKWSAWEKVDAAIQAVSHSNSDASDGDKKTGVHLIPVVWKNRLILFWPEFMEKVEKTDLDTGTSFKDLAESTSPVFQEPKKYWEIRLAWSEYYDKKWTAKQVSEEFYRLSDASWTSAYQKIDLNQISFHTYKIEPNGPLTIYMVPFPSELQEDNIGTSNEYAFAHFSAFNITHLLDKIKITVYNQELFKLSGNPLNDFLGGLAHAAAIAGGFYRNSRLLGTYKYSFQKTSAVQTQLKFNNYYIGSSTLKHQLLFPNQLQYNDDPRLYPFFYSANDKTYFVKRTYIKEVKQIWDQIASSDNVVFKILGHIAAGALEKVLDFNTFHHPYVSNFISNLNKNGIGTTDNNNTGLLNSDIGTTYDDGIHDDGGSYFDETFTPNYGMVFNPVEEELNNPLQTYYKETIDFDPLGANSKYNWELFFHAPLYIATQLSKNGKFKEAMQWFHYIFDPTTDETPILGTESVARFWKLKPFKVDSVDSFEEFMNKLSPFEPGNAEDPVMAEWRDHPFDSHLVASNFSINYKKHVVLAYIENLVNWGDSLFRKFTRENVYEAIQLYIIAGHILGPKPQFVPERGLRISETFESLRPRLNEMSNARREMENLQIYSSDGNDIDGDISSSLSGTGLSYYFCVPPNEKLLEYWEIVEDRLYKIRNCKDISGVARRLALFAPRIDPAALIKAKSAGLDLDTIFSELNAPNPHYRFAYLLQKANEFCNDVKSLGAMLLSALEKKDGEELSRIRATQESGMLQLIQKVRERQVLDAEMATKQLLKQRETAIFRFKYYNETLLENDSVDIPDITDLEAELNRDSQISTNPDIDEISPKVNTILVETDESGLKISSKEKLDLDKREKSLSLMKAAAGMDMIGSVAALFPNIEGKIQPFGVGVGAGFGGQNIAQGTQMISANLQRFAGLRASQGSIASITGSYIIREQDRTLQANLAAKEIGQLERQILSAGIRIQIAEKELENHKRQIENAENIEAYLRDKFSSKELYLWMKDELTTLHKQAFDLAFEMAKKAEMAFQFEKGDEIASYLEYDYWDSGKYGLLAGEKLQMALRQLDIAYQEKNTREFELTKHISLRRLNPTEFIKLKATGNIEELQIPEWLFDLDCPGHYRRKIKRVGISIPAIAGPYTGVNCKLTLKSSNIRTKPNLNDDSLKPTLGAINSIVTSNAQNDDGMFEGNFRDERYLPFEGAGVDSVWGLELPEFRQYDYNTISDVILHISYTAIDDDDDFRTVVITDYETKLANVAENGLYRLFDLKHDFPKEWHRFKTGETDNFEATLQEEHFPYYAPEGVRTINEHRVFSIKEDGSLTSTTGKELDSENMKIIVPKADTIYEEDGIVYEKEVFVVVQFTIKKRDEIN